MTILIAYATTEGQTRKIARFCADVLVEQGYSVELLDVRDTEGLDLSRFGGVILAGSVHAGRIQAPLEAFASQHGRLLAQIPALYLQVSLAAAGDDPKERADLDRIADDFFETAGWRPTRIEHVAGAFRFSEYDFFKSWAMRMIAAQHSRTVDPHEDTEFTDWAALRSALEAWRAHLTDVARSTA